MNACLKGGGVYLNAKFCYLNIRHPMHRGGGGRWLQLILVRTSYLFIFNFTTNNHCYTAMHKHSRCDYTMCSRSYFTHKNLHRNRILRTGIPNPRVMWIRNTLINNSYLVKVVIFQVASETAALNTGAILLRQYSIKFIYSHNVPHWITTFPLSEVL